jgi:NAD(P)-dependent dehydrogenase (short-subunit alcohol dehydrogenase family)
MREKGRAAAEPLRRDGINIRSQRLDVTNDQSVREAAAAFERSIGRLERPRQQRWHPLRHMAASGGHRPGRGA